LRTLKIAIGILLALLVLFLLGPTPHDPILSTKVKPLDLSMDGLDEYMLNKEGEFNIVKGAEAQVIWADSVPKVTTYSVVYLHGFSATHPEGQPIHINFAKRYGLNLYLSRLADHGLVDDQEPMLNLSPDRLYNSAKEAIAIGRLIGEQVIVIATSTGATMALHLASGGNDIHSLILYSPNVDLADESSKILNYPWGLNIARMVVGSDYYEYDNQDNPGRRYWTNRYRLEAVQTVRTIVDHTMTEEVFMNVEQPVFVGYYYKNEEEKDNSVSIPAIHDMVKKLGTDNEKIRVINFPDADAHVISSQFTSKSWKAVQTETFRFAEEVLNLKPINAY